jgi:hypothetical protein
MIEIYKKILDFDYEISNYGNIRNIKTGRIMKKQLVRNSITVNLRKDKKNNKFYLTYLLIIIYRDGFEDCDWNDKYLLERIETFKN